MEKVILKSLVLVSFFFVLASSQSQVSHLATASSAENPGSGSQLPNNNNNQKNEHLNLLKSQEPATYNGVYPGYRTGVSSGVATSPGNTQGYTYTGYTQEVSPYGGGSAPIFGLSSNGDFQFAAYFGPLFWGCVTAVVVVALLLFAIRLFGGFEKLGGFVKNIGEKTASGKSLDVDKLTSFVYKAIDKYGSWNQGTGSSSS